MKAEAPFTKGAEAAVSRSTYLGRRVVVKTRMPKSYRDPVLDSRIRSQRTRAEARLVREARIAGVGTPLIYSVDLSKGEIVMENVGGTTVKSLLDDNPESASGVCESIGRDLARLHDAGISHGDLTTSNMMCRDGGGICYIDFSMGASDITEEEMGTDLRLLERALASAHPDVPDAYDMVAEAYAVAKKDAQGVFDKIEEIKARGRYT